MGFGPGSNATYNLSGGYLRAYNTDMGCFGVTGTFTQSGGTQAVSNLLQLGFAGTGAYSLSGGFLNASYTMIGYMGLDATGAFTQSGGTNASSYLYLGYNDFTSGTYSLSGSGLLSTNIEYLGYSGTGSFTQSGGTNAVSGSLCLAYTSGSSGTYNLNGGVLSIAALSQGNGAAAFNFGGGTLQAAGQFSTTVAMTLTGSGGNATVNTSGYAVTFSGNLSGPAGLVKTGNNALTLTARTPTAAAPSSTRAISSSVPLPPFPPAA